jgi:hypothetical protein
MPLSDRFYWADAAFGAFIEGPDELIEALAQAIVRPVFPLYLGRRACPPTMPLRLAVHDGAAWDALQATPWLAAKFYQRKRKEARVSLRVVADQGIIPVKVGAACGRTLQDVPISFDSQHRRYSLRTVEETRIEVENPEFVPGNPQPMPALTHDPMEVL